MKHATYCTIHAFTMALYYKYIWNDLDLNIGPYTNAF